MTIKSYIQRYILLKIDSGDWETGTKLPSENQLAMKFNCSRLTARQALIPLVNSGFLKAIKGKGYIVSEDSQDYNLKSFIERYNIKRTEVDELNVDDDDIQNYLGLKAKDRYIIFEKKYFDEEGILAYQRTYLNNEYIWDKNLDGFKKSITKELAIQGTPITESSIEIIFIEIESMNEVAKVMGYNERYPIEIIKSFSDDHWIERTIRIVRPDKFRISYSKTKFS